MTRIRGVHGGSLKQLVPALQRWIRVMEDPEFWRGNSGPDDAAWWYNERALLSLFAGAIWTSKGWALEEFATTKRQRVARKGKQRKDGARGDLEFWWPSSNTSFLCEAKRAELSLRVNTRKLRKQIGLELDECVADVRCHPRRRGARRVGLLFVAPYLARGASNRKPLNKDECEYLKSFGKLLHGLSSDWDCAVAWTFPGMLPRPKGVLPSLGTRAYPGAAIVVADANGWF
jgi:hypothetical protein